LIEGSSFEASERGTVVLLKGGVKATIYPKAKSSEAVTQ
jgi:hypothetical protein